MSKYRQQKEQNLNQLLFSSSHGEDSHNLSPEHSYNEIDDCEEEFIYNMTHDEKWHSNDNLENQFLRINGPSVEFSQNYSQNSMMFSNRQDDDSRDYKQEANKCQQLLEQKKKQQILFNEALDQELNSVKKELEKSQLQNARDKSFNKALQLKLKAKEQRIQQLEGQCEVLQAENAKMRNEKADILKSSNQRNEFFDQYKRESTKILSQLSQKDRENNLLKKEKRDLQLQVQRLNEMLSDYIEPDRKLLDFRGGYTGQPYESPLAQKKNQNQEKQVEKLRKQKNSLEVELSALRDRLQDKQNRSKLLEEQHKKKIRLKEVKIGELQQKLGELKDDQLKIKTQNQIAQQKLTNNLNSKVKEINALNDKISEFDKRIKTSQQQSRKKDQKVRELNLEIIDKNRTIAQSDKEKQEMRIKLQFDHHMIEDKDHQIQRLMQERKTLRQQVQNVEKSEKNDKADKTERQKIRKQNQKVKKQSEGYKKQIQSLKKQCQSLQKQKEEIQASAKQSKKKFDQISKKMQQLRNSNTQLQQQSRKREEDQSQQKQALDKAMRQLTEYRKKSESIPQLRNKIILLQSRLKNQSQYRETGESFQSASLQDRIQALQHRLQQRDKENKHLKTQLRNGAQCSDQEINELELELADRMQQIQRLLKILQKQEKQMEQMKRDLAFKDQTLDFTHKILVNSEKAKIQLQQQKKLLQEMVHQQGSFQGTNQELTQFYEQKIQQLQIRLQGMRRSLKEKDEQHRFEVKQMKQRIKQINDALLNKERKITPQTMSQEDTVSFLIKTIKRVNRSADMLRILSRHQQFRQGLAGMDKQFRK